MNNGDPIIRNIAAVYFIIANIAAVALTIYDKQASMNHKRRISEAGLLLAAALSGCVLEYITMRIIHHKTKHPKFMIGIPAIFAFEVIAVIILLIVLPH